MMRSFPLIVLLAALAPVALGAGPDTVTTGTLPDLPRAISNNAVAALVADAGIAYFSFLGLGTGKHWSDASSAAFALAPGASAWLELPEVPGGQGRLGGSAVAVAGRVYIFGGYTVAADGSEKSMPHVHAFDPERGDYSTRQPMPVPVDDSLAVAHRRPFHLPGLGLARPR